MDNLAALLDAREEEPSAIYENVPGIVFYIAVEPDGEFRFLSVSRGFLAATGSSREQVVGSVVGDVIPPPSRDMVLNHYREAIRSAQPVRWEEKSVYPAGPRRVAPRVVKKACLRSHSLPGRAPFSVRAEARSVGRQW